MRCACEQPPEGYRIDVIHINNVTAIKVFALGEKVSLSDEREGISKHFIAFFTMSLTAPTLSSRLPYVAVLFAAIRCLPPQHPSPTAHPSWSRAYFICNKDKKVKGALLVVRAIGINNVVRK